MDNKEKNVIEELKEIQSTLPNVVLPTMGILENDSNIVINNKDFIKQNISKEN